MSKLISFPAWSWFSCYLDYFFELNKTARVMQSFECFDCLLSSMEKCWLYKIDGIFKLNGKIIDFWGIF